jgi:hypothetical protein
MLGWVETSLRLLVHATLPPARLVPIMRHMSGQAGHGHTEPLPQIGVLKQDAIGSRLFNKPAEQAIPVLPIASRVKRPPEQSGLNGSPLLTRPSLLEPSLAPPS